MGAWGPAIFSDDLACDIRTDYRELLEDGSHITDLSPGDVLAYTLPDGKLALFRVARLDAHRVGTAPILRKLDWRKSSLPSGRKLAKLEPLPETRPMDGKPCMSFRVARHRKKDEDWRDVGFAVVGWVHPSPEDGQFAPGGYTAWHGLRTSLDNGW